MSDLEDEFDGLDDEDLEADEEAEELGDDDAIEDLDGDDDDLDDLDEETRNELKAVEDALSQKEQNARSLAIRRAIEERLEKRRMHDDLDYLDD
jgi:hypothetical protein